MPRTGAAAARQRGILAPPPPPPPPAVTVQERPGRGRCLLASRDIAKGEARCTMHNAPALCDPALPCTTFPYYLQPATRYLLPTTCCLYHLLPTTCYLRLTPDHSPGETILTEAPLVAARMPGTGGSGRLACERCLKYATQGSNQGLADPTGRSATHTSEPRLGQVPRPLRPARLRPRR